MSDTYQADEQDQSEAFDETHSSEDAAEFTTFDEMADVYDVTQALGDGRDVSAADADEFDENDLDDEDLEEDGDVDDRADDGLEDGEADETDLTDDNVDENDGVTRLAADEVDIEYTGDVDAVTDVADEDAGVYEADGVSDDDLQKLGYTDASGRAMASGGGATPADDDDGKGTGACADDVPDEAHPRQEELLDEGVEETFPASDPVSVKHIT